MAAVLTAPVVVATTAAAGIVRDIQSMPVAELLAFRVSDDFTERVEAACSLTGEPHLGVWREVRSWIEDYAYRVLSRGWSSEPLPKGIRTMKATIRHAHYPEESFEFPLPWQGEWTTDEFADSLRRFILAENPGGWLLEVGVEARVSFTVLGETRDWITEETRDMKFSWELAAGYAVGKDRQAREWLERWAYLACRPEWHPTDPEGAGETLDLLVEASRGLASVEAVEQWAGYVLSVARDCEHNLFPKAGAYLDEEYRGERVSLWWEGTWTKGRFVTVSLWEVSEPGEFAVLIEWDTGTKRYSSFLEWPDQEEIEKTWDDWGVPTE